jgi:hypothetical protein
MSLSAKLSGQNLYRVEVTRTFVGYVIADCETTAASFIPRILRGVHDTEDVNIHLALRPASRETMAELVFHEGEEDITVREYLAAKGGER